ncbi:MAG: ATP-binding cassette domain-containing protein, partial [Myxococcota bacterium]
RGIVGELAPLSGHCVLGERDTWRQIEARTSIGYAPSEPEISAHLTVGEALQFHASLRNAPDWPWRKMLSEIGLPSTLLLSEASAGQRKRAELACALAGDPDLLVLDEPFEHLDSLAKEWLAGALDTLRTERIIVMTHHGDSPLRFDSERDVNG